MQRVQMQQYMGDMGVAASSLAWAAVGILLIHCARAELGRFVGENDSFLPVKGIKSRYAADSAGKDRG